MLLLRDCLYYRTLHVCRWFETDRRPPWGKQHILCYRWTDRMMRHLVSRCFNVVIAEVCIWEGLSGFANLFVFEKIFSGKVGISRVQIIVFAWLFLCFQKFIEKWKKDSETYSRVLIRLPRHEHVIALFWH